MKNHNGTSIIIVVRDEGLLIGQLMKTFFKSNTHQPFEFIILDHTPSEHIGDVLNQYSTRAFIRRIKRSRDSSTAASHNFAVQKTRYPNLLFLSEDILYTADILPTAVKKMEDSNIGAVGVRLGRDSGTLSEGANDGVQHADIQCVRTEIRGYCRPEQIRHPVVDDSIVALQNNGEQSPVSKSTSRITPHSLLSAASGTFLFCRKTDFEKINGFSKDYDCGVESIDFCLRLGEKLKKTCWCLNELSLMSMDVAHWNISDKKTRRKTVEKNHAILKNRWDNYNRELIDQSLAMPEHIFAPVSSRHDLQECCLPLPANGASLDPSNLWTKQRHSYYIYYNLPIIANNLKLTVAIIILNRNGAHHLENLFNSFLKNNTYANYTLYIVDHGSQDTSLELCHMWSKYLNIIVYPRNLNYSFSASNNFAVRQCNEDLLFFLNNDIDFHQDTLEKMVAQFADPCLGMLGVKLWRCHPKTHAKTTLHHLGILFSFAQPNRPFLPYEIHPKPVNHNISCSWYVPAITGAALMLRRDDFQSVQGFDEGFFYGYEDVDLCLTFSEKIKKRIVCLNMTSAVHDCGATRNNACESDQKRILRNRLLLEDKHAFFIRRHYKKERFERAPVLRQEPIKVAFAVSAVNINTPKGDFFTATEIADRLHSNLGWEVFFLPPDKWYKLVDIDVVVAMVHDFRPHLIESQNPYLLKIAWCRNQFEKWLSFSHIKFFDQIWAASDKAARALSKKWSKPVPVIRIATNELRFNKGVSSPDYVSDYCFTGSYFNVKRQIMTSLDPATIPFRFALFGYGWEKVPALAPYHRGSLPYTSIVQVYRSTRIVIDDANHTVLGWGSVNSRVFDALATGALVITNDHQGSKEAFDGLLPVYRSKDDLHEMVQYYLQNEVQRLELVMRLHQIVLQRHTYARRSQEIQNALHGFFVNRMQVILHVPKPSTEHPMKLDGLITALTLHGHSVIEEGKFESGRTWKFGCDAAIYCLMDYPDRQLPSRFVYQANILVTNVIPKSLKPESLEEYDMFLINDAENISELQDLTEKPVFCLADARNASETDGSRIENLLKQVIMNKAGSAITELYYPPPQQRVCLRYFPDYTSTNPYQQLLYKPFPACIETEPGTIDTILSDIGGLSSDFFTSWIFHLHWTSAVIGKPGSKFEARQRVTSFVDKIDKFISLGGRLLWTIHNFLSHESPYPEIETELCCAMALRAETIHVHSALVCSLAHKHYEIPKYKTITAPHGNYIDVYPGNYTKKMAREMLGLPASVPVFLFFGQIRPYKGIDNLKEAFAACLERFPDVHLFVAGNPVAMDMSEITACFQGVENVLFDLLHIPDTEVSQYLYAADYLVLPYKCVLTSGSVILGQSYGLPIIAPDLGMLREHIRDGQNGYLYDSDSSDGLYLSMIRALDNHGQYTALAANAYKTAQEMRWETAAEILAGRVLSGNRGWSEVVMVDQIPRVCQISGKTTTWSPMDSAAIRTAVVVLHYQHVEDTAHCVHSLLSQKPSVPDIYIVTNNPLDDSFNRLSAMFPTCRVIQSPENLGYAGGNNIGLAYARTIADYDFYWLLNPDAVAPEDLYANLSTASEKYPETAIFGSIIYFGDRPDIIWYGGGLIDWHGGLETTHAYIGKKHDVVPSIPYATDYITGACIFFRAHMLNAVGYLPEQYFLYFEETHWCLKAKNMGFLINVFPNTYLTHWKRSETNGVPTTIFLYYYCRNALIFTKEFMPEKIPDTVDKLKVKVKQWEDIINKHSPERLTISKLAINAGIKDGFDNRSGKMAVNDNILFQ